MGLKSFTTGMAVGYVFGARAGEQRYDQLSAIGERLLESPWVGRALAGGREIATEAGRRMLEEVRYRAGLEDDGDERDEDDVEDETADDVDDEAPDDVDDEDVDE